VSVTEAQKERKRSQGMKVNEKVVGNGAGDGGFGSLRTRGEGHMITDTCPQRRGPKPGAGKEELSGKSSECAPGKANRP